MVSHNKKKSLGYLVKFQQNFKLCVDSFIKKLSELILNIFRLQYVALYDYDPFKSSPNPNPSLELAFREGDAMTIYDTSRSDGFYAAEVIHDLQNDTIKFSLATNR